MWKVNRSEFSFRLKYLLNMNNNYTQNVAQNWIIQFFRLNLSNKEKLWRASADLIQLESKFKNYNFFGGFLSVIHILVFSFAFLYTKFERNDKYWETKATNFSNRKIKQKKRKKKKKIYIYIYIYMQISLNIIDILCLHIFFWIRSNSRITFIVLRGNWFMYCP